MHNHQSLTLATLVLGTSLLGCRDGTSPTPTGYCLAPRSLAVVLDVTDSVSGVGLAGQASGTVIAGAYQDSLHHSASATILVGGDRIGTYSVTVQHPGYRDWTRSDVVVAQVGSCGNVIPVQVAARLVGAP
jgi:hypothetical protein